MSKEYNGFPNAQTKGQAPEGVVPAGTPSGNVNISNYGMPYGSLAHSDGLAKVATFGNEAALASRNHALALSHGVSTDSSSVFLDGAFSLGTNVFTGNVDFGSAASVLQLGTGEISESASFRTEVINFSGGLEILKIGSTVAVEEARLSELQKLTIKQLASDTKVCLTMSTKDAVIHVLAGVQLHINPAIPVEATAPVEAPASEATTSSSLVEPEPTATLEQLAASASTIEASAQAAPETKITNVPNLIFLERGSFQVLGLPLDAKVHVLSGGMVRVNVEVHPNTIEADEGSVVVPYSPEAEAAPSATTEVETVADASSVLGDSSITAQATDIPLSADHNDLIVATGVVEQATTE